MFDTQFCSLVRHSLYVKSAAGLIDCNGGKQMHGTGRGIIKTIVFSSASVSLTDNVNRMNDELYKGYNVQFLLLKYETLSLQCTRKSLK